MLANPQIAGALSDLMPLRNQHGTHNWGHIFWPQRPDDYPEPIEVDEDEDVDDMFAALTGERKVKKVKRVVVSIISPFRCLDDSCYICRKR